MGCQCFRDHEIPQFPEYPKEEEDADLPATMNTRASPAEDPITLAVVSTKSTKTLQLALPGNSSVGSSPSNPQSPSGGRTVPRDRTPSPRPANSRVPRERTPSPSPQTPNSRVDWTAVSLEVGLRGIRTVPGPETSYQLDRCAFVRAEHLDTRKKCWIQTYEVKADKQYRERRRTLLTIKALDHPNVLKMLDLFQDNHHLYAVYEATHGGTAQDLSECAQGLNEQWVATIMRQVFAALGHCHSKGLTLKSLCLRHILFTEPPTENCASVKLLVPLGDQMERNSPYIAPELKTMTYAGVENDLWSCGVILSSLLTGKLVLLDMQTSLLLKEFRDAYNKWQQVSKEVKVLTTALISRDYSKRPTVAECLQHPWLSLPSPSFIPIVRMALRRMAKASPLSSLKKTFLQLMLNLVVPYEDLKEPREAFRELDSDLDGTVTSTELRVQLLRLFPEEQAQAALAAITSTAVFSEDGKLAYSEFLLWACDRQTILSSSSLAMTFQLLDADKDGCVTSKELREQFSLEQDNSPDSYAWRALLSLVNPSKSSFHYRHFCRFMSS